MLSIIIPALNEEKYLPILLEEIKKQKFDDYEIIVADAGSEDKTVEIAKNYGCRVVRGGLPAKGRNEGAKTARGDLFLFMDADNIYLPENFLNNLLREFKKRNLGAASFSIYIKGNKFDRIALGIYNWWTETAQNFSPLAFNSILVKREIHEASGGFDEDIKIAEDVMYARESKKYGQFGFIKTEPVLTSARRLEKDGRLKAYFRPFIVGLYMLFFGPVKSDIFKYRFGYLDKEKKNKIE